MENDYTIIPLNRVKLRHHELNRNANVFYVISCLWFFMCNDDVHTGWAKTSVINETVSHSGTKQLV